MARDKTVRLSDEEHAILKDLREEIFGSDNTPLGKVITELAGRRNSTDLSSDESSGGVWVDQIIEHQGRAILIGGRRIGKTRTLVKKADERARDGDNVLLVAVAHRMAVEIGNRLEEYTTDSIRQNNDFSIGEGNVYIRSALELRDNFKLDAYDAILVDEAGYVDQSVVMYIDRSSVSDITYATSPHNAPDFISLWAEYSDYHTTWHVAMSDVSHIPSARVNEFEESLSDQQRVLEVDGKYWTGDAPSKVPYYTSSEDVHNVN